MKENSRWPGRRTEAGRREKRKKLKGGVTVSHKFLNLCFLRPTPVRKQETERMQQPCDPLLVLVCASRFLAVPHRLPLIHGANDQTQPPKSMLLLRSSPLSSLSSIDPVAPSMNVKSHVSGYSSSRSILRQSIPPFAL